MGKCSTGDALHCWGSLGGSSWTGVNTGWGYCWEPPPSKLCKNTMLQVYTLRIASVSHKSGCPDSGNYRRLPCEESSRSSILQGREVSCLTGRHILHLYNVYVIYGYCNCFFLAGRQALRGTGLSASTI